MAQYSRVGGSDRSSRLVTVVVVTTGGWTEDDEICGRCSIRPRLDPDDAHRGCEVCRYMVCKDCQSECQSCGKMIHDHCRRECPKCELRNMCGRCTRGLDGPRPCNRCSVSSAAVAVLDYNDTPPTTPPTPVMCKSAGRDGAANRRRNRTKRVTWSISTKSPRIIAGSRYSNRPRSGAWSTPTGLMVV